MPAQPGNDVLKAPSAWRPVVLPLLLLGIAIALVGIYAYQAATGAATNEVAADMEAIAKLKGGQIELWLRERSDNVHLIASPRFTATLQAWLDGGRRDRSLEERLLQKLQFAAADRYRDVALLSPVDGRPLLAVGAQADGPATRARAVESAKRRAPLVEDITAAAGDNASGATIGLFQPVSLTADGPALGVIHVAMDLGDVLLPSAQIWPFVSRSAEFLLMRPDGDDVLYLNTVRHLDATALRLRHSLALPNFIGARLIREGQGYFEGDDYRGVPCLAYGMPLAGTPWYLIAKIDRAEAYAHLDVVAAVCAAMLGALLLACGWWLVKRRRAEETQRTLNRTVRLMSDCNRALVEADTERTLLDAVCRLVVETGGYRMAWIGLPRQDAARTVHIASRFGYEAGYLETGDISWADTAAGHGPTGTAIREGCTQVNQDFRTNPRLVHWREAALARAYESNVALPLMLGKEVLGALTIYSSVPHAFGADEVALLENLARDLAHGIGSLRLRVAHQRAEEELRLNEERMRALFGGISDALFVHGMQADGKPACFVEVNDVACQRLGYSRAELLTMSPLDIEAPGCAIDAAAIVEKLSTQRSVIFESVHVARDGHRIPVEISLSMFALRGNRMFVSLARDVTERRRFERERVESESQLATLSAHLQSVREEERAIIARELHDELGQVLTALKMDISWLKSQTPAQAVITDKFDGMTSLVDATLGSVRRIAADLRPTMLDDLGLPAATEWLVEEFAKRHPHIDCKLVLDFGGCEVDEARAIAAYRIVQECLTNVARHAEATKLHVALGVRAGRRLVICIQDNGCGLGPLPTGGFGLIGMRQRVHALGGSFVADSMPGEGVVIDVVMPLAGGALA